MTNLTHNLLTIGGRAPVLYGVALPFWRRTYTVGEGVDPAVHPDVVEFEHEHTECRLAHNAKQILGTTRDGTFLVGKCRNALRVKLWLQNAPLGHTALRGVQQGKFTGWSISMLYRLDAGGRYDWISIREISLARLPKNDGTTLELRYEPLSKFFQQRRPELCST